MATFLASVVLSIFTKVKGNIYKKILKERQVFLHQLGNDGKNDGNNLESNSNREHAEIYFYFEAPKNASLTVVRTNWKPVLLCVFNLSKA